MEIKSVKRSNAQRPSELRTRLNAKCKERKISIEKDAYSYFMISYSTLNRRLSSEDQIEPAVVKKMAEFLEASEDEILLWHGYTKKTVFSTEPEIYKKPNNFKIITSLNILVFTCLILVYNIITTNNSFKQSNIPTTYTTIYSGSSDDIDLSHSVSLPDFHSAIFKYEFENGVVKISGEKINFSANIDIVNRIDPDIKYKGKFVASGLYSDGNAAVTYKTTVDINKESWIGTMMLKIPDAGNSHGYWLSIYNDPDDKSFGDFVFGELDMARVLTNQTQK